MPTWLQELLTGIIIALVEKLASALRNSILDKIIDKEVEDRKESRSVVIAKLLKAEELDDDSIRILHRSLRDANSQ
jgi:hypothetical protein